jgi:hypothetical protein
MLTLRIKSKGQLIQLPGSAPFRTPATIDVSKMKIRNLIGYLRQAAIEDYEIVATSDKGVREVYKKSDFDLPQKKDQDSDSAYKKAINKRFNKLEKLIKRLVDNQDSKNTSNKEQTIDDKLNRIEKLLEEKVVREVIYTKDVSSSKVPDVEELDEEIERFIPEVQIDDMKLSSSSTKTIEKRKKDDVDDAADSLSKILGGKK